MEVKIVNRGTSLVVVEDGVVHNELRERGNAVTIGIDVASQVIVFSEDPTSLVKIINRGPEPAQVHRYDADAQEVKEELASQSEGIAKFHDVGTGLVIFQHAQPMPAEAATEEPAATAEESPAEA